RDRGGVREPVARPDDEGVEGVLRVQPGRLGRGRRGLGPVERLLLTAVRLGLRTLGRLLLPAVRLLPLLLGLLPGRLLLPLLLLLGLRLLLPVLLGLGPGRLPLRGEQVLAGRAGGGVVVLRPLLRRGRTGRRRIGRGGVRLPVR